MRLTCAGIQAGYTLVELIVALLLFAVGGLALASTSAVLGKSINSDGLREQTARVAGTQIEILAAGCQRASSGSKSDSQIRSEWTVSRPTPNTIEIAELVSYADSHGRRSDSYHKLIACP
ncbi:MAG TPA: prepilin-type N-terminal cleavage/methylation domain-containing protein [Gemmatimonadaceae bacterium]